jgi:hypothetical protein
VKLFCNGDVVCFVGFEWVWDLTRDFAGVFRGLFCKLMVLWGLLDDDGKNGKAWPVVKAENRQKRNTGILHFVQDDDLKTNNSNDPNKQRQRLETTNDNDLKNKRQQRSVE